MKVMMIQFVSDVLGTVSKDLVKSLENFAISGDYQDYSIIKI